MNKKEYMKRWRKEHHLQILESKRLYYHKHKEIINKQEKLKYEINPEKYKKKSNDYYKLNKDICNKRCKKYADLNKESKKIYDKQYNILNMEKKKNQWHKYYISHIKEKKQYINNNKLKINKASWDYRKNKLKNNPLFKLRTNIGKSLYKSLININSKKGGRSWETLLGYTKNELKEHLENQFTPEMNWTNYGTYWHVDHIIPISWFTTEEQQIKKGWRLSNLQPLEADINIKKLDNYCGNPKTNLGTIYL